MMWVPGYWSYNEASKRGYFWVPAAWIPTPFVGALWTPPYWEKNEFSVYVFHPGYWGHHVGYYGGIHYGFGYNGIGFVGAEWRGDVLWYNTEQSNAYSEAIHSTYLDRTIAKEKTVLDNSRISFTGPGGVQHKPLEEERVAEHEEHTEPTEIQRQMLGAAQNDLQAYASNNEGLPKIAARGIAPGVDIVDSWRPKPNSTTLSADAVLSKTEEQADRGPSGGPQAQPSASSSRVPIPHNYALVFATNDYERWTHLANPIPDADALSQTIESLYNFQVEEVRNPTNEKVLAKLTEYLHRKFEPQDQLIIFFSGHGYFDTYLGQGFIVPANAPKAQDDPGHVGLIPHSTIMQYVNRIKANHVLLIIDACFAGTLDRKIAEGTLRGDVSTDDYAHASLLELLKRKELKHTRRWFASGGNDFVPDGAPGHHSPFMAALLVALNSAADHKGYATLEDIQVGLNTVKPESRWGEIQDENDPGADLILLTPTAIRKLSQLN